MQRTKYKGKGNGFLALAILVTGLALVSCRQWDNPLDPIGDQPPTMPFNPSPADFGMTRDSGLVLSWQSQDPDSGDTAYFDVFFDTVSPPRLAEAGWIGSSFQPIDVYTQKRYYWRVIAYDNHRRDSVVGPLWQFEAVDRISVTAPDSSDRLIVSTTDTIAWTGGPSAAVDSIVVLRSTDDGLSWLRLGQSTTPGEFVWQVPAPATQYARVKVVGYASTDTVTGVSGRFGILDSTAASGKGSR